MGLRKWFSRVLGSQSPFVSVNPGDKASSGYVSMSDADDRQAKSIAKITLMHLRAAGFEAVPIAAAPRAAVFGYVTAFVYSFYDARQADLRLLVTLHVLSMLPDDKDEEGAPDGVATALLDEITAAANSPAFADGSECFVTDSARVRDLRSPAPSELVAVLKRLARGPRELPETPPAGVYMATDVDHRNAVSIATVIRAALLRANYTQLPSRPNHRKLVMGYIDAFAKGTKGPDDDSTMLALLTLVELSKGESIHSATAELIQARDSNDQYYVGGQRCFDLDLPWLFGKGARPPTALIQHLDAVPPG